MNFKDNLIDSIFSILKFYLLWMYSYKNILSLRVIELIVFLVFKICYFLWKLIIIKIYEF